ncbi:MAG: MBL fold metallo-hydrolase [Candidatus Korobacteraceae bacterium]|jgi:glyoxylase-like metal-dependent hydrolase (beta-lactamase superfamily II)
MKMELVFQGFPGKLSRGYMGWSSVVYIETQGTKIVFDTGGPGKRSDLRARLQECGAKAEDIDILVFSHFHDDHVYNFDYFPKAKILLHAKESEWVKTDPDSFPIPKFLYPAVVNTGRLQLIEGEVEIAPGVQTIFTPGHTPGCMSLVLRDKDMPTTVLAGDAVKNISELATGKVAMSWNNDCSAQSIAKIRKIAEVVVAGHDRMLQVFPDKISAIGSIHETIIIPPGVADGEKPRYLELVIEPTSLPIS